MFNIPADSLTARLMPLQQALTADALPAPIMEFGPYLPDLGELGNPGVTEAQNCIAYKDHYAPFKSLSAVSDAMTARAQGGTATRDSSGNVFVVLGDASKLYSLINTAFTDVSQAGGYTVAADSTWEFATFGNDLIATHIDDPVQVLDMATGNVFADLITSSDKPKARHVDIVNGFVVLGNTSDDSDGAKPNRVWWSALETPTNFTPAAATLGGYQDLPTGGHVQRIVGGENYGLVFSDDEIRRMTFVGSPRIFTFSIIDKKRGTPIPNSIVSFGRFTAFLSEEGFFITDGNESFPIGENQVDNFFWDQFSLSNRSRVSAAVDPVRKLLLWSFPGTGSSGGKPNIALIWNWKDKRWSHADFSHETLIRSRDQGYTLDTLDTVGTDIDDASLFPFSFDSPAWQGGDIVLGGVDTSHRYGTFTGTTLAAQIDTGRFQPNSAGLADLTGISPIVEGSTAVTAKIAAAQQAGATFTLGSAVAMNSFGKANFSSNGQYFKAATIIAAAETGWKARGVRVHATSAGDL